MPNGMLRELMSRILFVRALVKCVLENVSSRARALCGKCALKNVQSVPCLAKPIIGMNTGILLSREELQRASDICKAAGSWLVM